MARTEKEMSDLLVSLYRDESDKNKGKFRLSKDQFKSMAGKEVLKDAYLWKVDSCLREDGFIVVDLRDERDQIAVLSIGTVMKKFQALSQELVDENEFRSNSEDDW